MCKVKASPFLFLLMLFTQAFMAQIGFSVHKLRLPDSVKLSKNEFSGLTIFKDKLILLPQNKNVTGPWSGIYTVGLPQLEQSIRDSNYTAVYKKQEIGFLDYMVSKIDRLSNSGYDGLEAITTIGDKVYISVETKDHVKSCYVIAGNIVNGRIGLDTSVLFSLPKPLLPNGNTVCNAGFESIVSHNGKLLAFFEYNYYEKGSSCLELDPASGRISKLNFPELPFRFTDASPVNSGEIVGLNFFYAAPDIHCETVYRPRSGDLTNRALALKNGSYASYCRLVALTFNGNKGSWKQVWTFPLSFQAFNWEGIAGFRNGFFVVNDEYAGGGKKYSELLFLERTE